MDASVLKRYDLQSRLGKGAYGIVWKAASRRSGRTVAIKKIFDAFRNRTDAQRTYREIVFLKEFRRHPNIIQLLNVYRAENDKDLYLVFEFMNTDLHHVIRRGNLLKSIHKRYVMYQLFKAAGYLHENGVIHRDIKPSNVLLDVDCNCKLADFGLARALPQSGSETEVVAEGSKNNQQCPMTDYVATRWYRAPELLLGEKRYTTGVDMWSLGCILGEMLVGEPLFPGKNTDDQIHRIRHVLGGFEGAVGAGTTAAGVGLAALLGGRGLQVGRQEVDMMQGLLRLNPENRLSSERAIGHEYVSEFNGRAAAVEDDKDNKGGRGDEDISKKKMEVALDKLRDPAHLSRQEYKEKLYDFILAQKRKQ